MDDLTPPISCSLYHTPSSRTRPPTPCRSSDNRSMLHIGVFLLHLAVEGEARLRQCGSQSGPHDRDEGEVGAYIGQKFLSTPRTDSMVQEAGKGI